MVGTDSSIATLPVTLRCAAQHGISDAVARFVLPLGANINMNGTALFEALTVIYIAQVHFLHPFVSHGVSFLQQSYICLLDLYVAQVCLCMHVLHMRVHALW